MDNFIRPAKNTSALLMIFYTALVFIVGLLACVVWLNHSDGFLYNFFSKHYHSNISENESLKKQQENILSAKIVKVIENVVGVGKVKAEVNLDVSFNQVMTSEEIFDPYNKAVRSRYSEPGASNVKESVHYEINRLTRSRISSGGTIKKISVMVLIDGIYDKAPDGTVIYKDRSDEEINRLADLIKPLIGFDAARGDVIKISNIPFAGSKGIFDVFKSDILEIGILIIIVLMSLLLLTKNGKNTKTSMGDSIKISSCDIKRVQDSIDANPVAAVEIIRDWLTGTDRIAE